MRKHSKPEFLTAPAGSQPSSETKTAKGKSIFLFADGTGNSSAKLFKTNVWRMYEVMNLGLSSPGEHVQIGYYDNGVGTSAFRPFALLGGIFGIGLAANVRRLYAFLCRNYQEGDRIYAFGFSRGAFTIRVLIDMVSKFGIIDTTKQVHARDSGAKLDEGVLPYQVRDVYRRYRRCFQLNRKYLRWITDLFRGARDSLIDVKRIIRRHRRLHEIQFIEVKEIEFVGVWDTVAAYGGPSAEFTRGIDDWVWPLSMPDYILSPKVKKARHALSLDDERDAFWPVLWDEVEEDRMVEAGEVAADRLQQVWFAGVHSDVGGGYPDESLSYISLLWMMGELGEDVDFLDDFVNRAKSLANPYGPIHDSRAGFGAYYRFQPRKIAAFMNPHDERTLSMRDPQRDEQGKRRGLLTGVNVHESALARIVTGIDNYAPSALPAEFETIATKGKDARAALTRENLDKFEAAAANSAVRLELQENGWDYAWKRRVYYFVTVGLTLALLLLPVLSLFEPIERLCDDDRCFAEWMVGKSLFFLPASMIDLLSPWTSKPIVLLLLLPIIFLLIAFGRRRERRFRDEIRTVWRRYLGLGNTSPLPAEVAPTKLRDFRESRSYQRIFHFFKWQILPAASAIVTILLVGYGATIVTTQTLYAFAEPQDQFCISRTDAGGLPSRSNVPFDTRHCTDLGVNVKANQAYEMRVQVTQPWTDRGLEADPEIGVHAPPAYLHAFTPLKRVTRANWMQPLTEVRDHNPGWFRKLVMPVFGPAVDIHRMRLSKTRNEGEFTGFFCPRRDGHLYLMVNDAAPLLLPHLYWNNGGTAVVSVSRAQGLDCHNLP
jgi:uncharacterized protein (DUF2235 family)